jgi:hypothetical protein
MRRLSRSFAQSESDRPEMTNSKSGSSRDFPEGEFAPGEVACVGAGLGGGFEHASELHVMKFKTAMATKDRQAWEVAVRKEHQRIVDSGAWKAVPHNEFGTPRILEQITTFNDISNNRRSRAILATKNGLWPRHRQMSNVSLKIDAHMLFVQNEIRWILQVHEQ